MSDKPISSMAYAPVVNSDTTSPESILARDSKKIEAQASTDGHFDTVLERFSNTQTPILLSLTLVLSLFLLSSLVQKRR
jgi:hypothetical protein